MIPGATNNRKARADPQPSGVTRRNQSGRSWTITGCRGTSPGGEAFGGTGRRSTMSLPFRSSLYSRLGALLGSWTRPRSPLIALILPWTLISEATVSAATVRVRARRHERLATVKRRMASRRALGPLAMRDHRRDALHGLPGRIVRAEMTTGREGPEAATDVTDVTASGRRGGPGCSPPTSRSGRSWCR